jgi:hypothetical protein
MRMTEGADEGRDLGRGFDVGGASPLTNATTKGTARACRLSSRSATIALCSSISARLRSSYSLTKALVMPLMDKASAAGGEHDV